MAKFSKSTFGMYGGEEVSVELLYPKYLIGVMLDRFSTDISVIDLKDGRYKSIVKVAKSNQFYGWITGLGPDVTIAGPETVVDEYKEYISKILENYNK